MCLIMVVIIYECIFLQPKIDVFKELYCHALTIEKLKMSWCDYMLSTAKRA